MTSLKDGTPPVETAGLEGCVASGKEAIQIYSPAPENTIKKRLQYAALELAEQGLLVFPCRANKVPTCPGGFKAGSANSDSVKALWRNHPGPLIGVRTGEISGFDVLDVDPRNGGEEWLNDNRSRLPETRTHRTKSGGWHLLFRHQNGLRNSASKIANGIDIRADGGYIIWWPSAGLPIADKADIAAWPEWLLALLMPKPRASESSPPPYAGGTAYARAALRKAARAVATAPEGRRNDTLNRECWSLLRFVHSGEVSAQEVATTLASAALSAGLTKREIISTLSSALRSRGIA